MATTVLLPPAQKSSRGALIALAIASGLNNTAQALFSISQRKQERELKEAQLAQQYLLTKERMDLSRQRMEELQQYREGLLRLQEQGQIDRREFNELMLAQRVDDAEARRQTTRDMMDLRRDIADQQHLDRQDAIRAQQSATPEREPTLGQAMEDLERLGRGLNPKHFRVRPTTPEQRQKLEGVLNDFIKKKTQPGFSMGQAMQDYIQSGLGGAPPPPAAPTSPQLKLPPGWSAE